MSTEYSISHDIVRKHGQHIYAVFISEEGSSNGSIQTDCTGRVLKLFQGTIQSCRPGVITDPKIIVLEFLPLHKRPLFFQW